MTYCPCVMLCYLTTCYSVESAWFQLLKVKCDELLSSFAFNFKLRRYNLERLQNEMMVEKDEKEKSFEKYIGEVPFFSKLGGGGASFNPC